MSRRGSSRRCVPAALRIGSALLALGSAIVARAGDDPNPYFIGVSEGITHDSNVYRVPTEVQGDDYLSTGVQGGIDQPFGGQRFHATGNARNNRFRHLTGLDNTSYGLDAGLDWVTIGSLSGTVRTTQNQSLATYGSTNQLALAAKNIQRLHQSQAVIRWGLPDARFGLEGGDLQESLRYSAVQYAPYETDQSVVHLGLVWRPSGRSTFGAALRRTSVTYAALQLADGSRVGYNRNDLDLTVVWIATGASTVNARVSLGRQTDRTGAAQGASTTTGSLQWTYTPVGKLSFGASIVRDTGQNTTFQSFTANGSTASLNGDNSQYTTTFALDAGYAFSAKVGATLALRASRRSLVDTVVASNGAAIAPAVGGDRIRTWTLGLTYSPIDAVALTCAVGHENRGVTDGTPLFLSYPYAAKTATCSAQVNVR